MYDSYEVEYLPNEGLVSTIRHLFIELTTDASGTSTGVAIRYQGLEPLYRPTYIRPPNRVAMNQNLNLTPILRLYSAFAAGHCYEPFVKYGNFTSSDSTWAVGTVVEFTCEPGYTLEQGSVIIECMDPSNPQWNETEPACRGV